MSYKLLKFLETNMENNMKRDLKQKVFLFFIIIILIYIFFTFTISSKIFAQEINVSSGNSIQAAINLALSNSDSIDYIYIGSGTFNEQIIIVIPNGQEIHITGNGADNTIISLPSGLNGNVISLDGGGRVYIDGIKVTNGTRSGILNKNSTNLIIKNCKIENNSSTFGGGINNIGILSADNCIINNNTATLNGGGIYNDGNLSITNSKITNNKSNLATGGGIYNAGTLNVTGCTISDNIAPSFSAIDTITSIQDNVAINNWWGSETGPYNQSFNPNGTANSVANNVNFIPFLTSDPFILPDPSPSSSDDSPQDDPPTGDATSETTTSTITTMQEEPSSSSTTTSTTQEESSSSSSFSSTPSSSPTNDTSYSSNTSENNSSNQDSDLNEQNLLLEQDNNYNDANFPNSNNNIFTNKNTYKSNYSNKDDLNNYLAFKNKEFSKVKNFPLNYYLYNYDLISQGFINLIYNSILERDPDYEGFLYWHYLLENNLKSPSNITREIFYSAENSQRLKKLNNEEFINYLYHSILFRQYDTFGYNYWLNKLINNNISKKELLNLFLKSEEWAQICSNFNLNH